MADVEIGYKGSTIASMNSSGTLTLDTAGTYCEDDITINYTRAGLTVVETLDSHGGTIVSISGDPITLQTKTVIPTESTQTIIPDSGYSGFTSVIVQGISSTYIGTDIPKMAESTYTPTTINQIISSGTYLSGSQTILGDINLVASNIASGVSIFGVVGTHQGGGGTAGWETAPESWASGLVDKTLSGSVYGSMVLNLKPYAFNTQYNLTEVSFPNCSIIESHVFQACTSLKSAYFLNCYTIYNDAFVNCSSLINISFPKCLSINQSAFSGCIGLTNISFPNCVYIASSVFYKCTNLEDIYFPKCISIGSYAFQSCGSLINIDFPNCVCIYNYAFQNCVNLVSAYFSNCISIGEQTFASCTNLITISLPKCISVGMTAFRSCSSLTTVSFPKCTSIGAYAFQSCINLVSVYLLMQRVPYIGTSAFLYTPITDSSYLGYYGSIYVLSSMLSSFKTATNWAVISDRIVGV